MDENFTRGYLQLHLESPNAGNSGLGPQCSRQLKNGGPQDKCSCIYIALLLCGVGFLLPYNSFITAVDYYQNKYPGTTIEFDMSLTYICVALFAVTINNLLVDVLRLHTRITFGYIISFVTLIFVALCDIWYDMFTRDVSYIITLAAVGITALGCTVQQSSFYGFTSMLPPRYTQAVMTGESAAGLLVSINRLLTKGLIPASPQENTIIFFVISVAFVMICCAVFHVTRSSDYVMYHVTMCKISEFADGPRCVSNPLTEEVSLVDILDGNTRSSHDGYGMLALKSSPTSPMDNCTKFENPCYMYQADNQDGIVNVNYQHNDPTLRVLYGEGLPRIEFPPTRWQRFKNGFHMRWLVARNIWPYMFSIGLAYFVTLCLFPGIESEVVSCRLGSWMPVILISTFNLFDFIGKIFASIRIDWARSRLVVLTCVRLVLIPLLMLCAAPRFNPLFKHEAWPICFSVLLGLSNGYFGSVPMIIAPTKVSDNQKEITGNIMMLSYSVGLASGSGVAYLLNLILGHHVTNICGGPLITNQTTDSWITSATTAVTTVQDTTGTMSILTTVMYYTSTLLTSTENSSMINATGTMSPFTVNMTML